MTASLGRTYPPVHTYSIVARDAETGQLGVAVQSHYFSVGSIVSWAEAGVGAVATQSVALVDYGPRGLALMREGLSARQALDALLANDPGRDVRQVAMVDARGTVAAHTGSRCIPAAGHVEGDGFSAQANLMVDDSVWPAMKRAFEESRGDLAERLLAALDAGQAAGGDIRGQQSAAMLIVSGERSPEPWRGRVFDLRVEDHPEPLAELRRLVRLRRAYRLADESDELLAAGDYAAARARLGEALTLAPENDELRFWAALTLFRVGEEAQALPMLREVFARGPQWAELVPRLAPLGLLPESPEALRRILAQRPDGGATYDHAAEGAT